METTEGLTKVATRREAVRKAVKRWRKTYPEKYNAYMREYLKKPGPKKRHTERCRAYRQRKREEKKTQLEGEVDDVLVPRVEVK